MNRRDAALELRYLIEDEGGLLVAHKDVPSRYDYSARPDRSAPRLDGTAGHWHGGHSRFVFMDRYGGRTLQGTLANVRETDRLHKVSKGWTRGFAYGVAICPWTGAIIEMRSFWVAWGAHRGDHDRDGIRANLEKFPIYLSIGGPDHITAALEEGYNVTIDALKRLDFAELPLDYLTHREIQGGTVCCGPRGTELVQVHRSGGRIYDDPKQETDVLNFDHLPIVKQTWPENRLPFVYAQRVQSLLAIEGFIDYGPNFAEDGEPDGLFGPSTREAVVNFQRARGLTPDGVVDGKTWQALMGLEI